MKKLLSFLTLILMSHLVFSQSENYKNIVDNFQTYYNNEKYDEIFNTFSPEMKQALPIDQTKQFLSNLKSQVGKIKDTEFIDYYQGTYAVFKTNFEKAVLSVNISLDEQNQINGLFIQPYKNKKETINNVVNALNSYPAEIAKIIYSKSKNLPDNAQLSIAVIENGKTHYYGIIKKNNHIEPIENQNKVFEIGSITKVFTSAVLASLIEKGDIKLTDEINTFYPFAFKDNITIRFENLANHTSGLARLPNNLNVSSEVNPYKDYGKTEINEYLKNLLKLDIEKTYAYSNLGTGLLGYTLGLSQHMSFQELLQKLIFNKYKMTNSFTSSQNLGNKLIKGMNKNGTIVSNWDFDVLFAAGGILSTTEDLVKFAKAQFNPENKELALTQKTTFDIDENMKIGLGWHVIKSKKGNDLLWHNGGTGGYSSSMIVNTENKTAVIILSNVFNINEDIDDLSFELINAIHIK